MKSHPRILSLREGGRLPLILLCIHLCMRWKGSAAPQTPTGNTESQRGTCIAEWDLHRRGVETSTADISHMWLVSLVQPRTKKKARKRRMKTWPQYETQNSWPFKITWLRTTSGGICNIWETSGRHLKTSGDIWKHLRGIWKALGRHLQPSGGIWSIWKASGRHLGDFRKHLGASEKHLQARESEKKMCEHHHVSLSKVAQASVSCKKCEGDPHDLRSLSA